MKRNFNFYTVWMELCSVLTATWHPLTGLPTQLTYYPTFLEKLRDNRSDSNRPFRLPRTRQGKDFFLTAQEVNCRLPSVEMHSAFAKRKWCTCICVCRKERWDLIISVHLRCMWRRILKPGVNSVPAAVPSQSDHQRGLLLPSLNGATRTFRTKHLTLCEWRAKRRCWGSLRPTWSCVYTAAPLETTAPLCLQSI